jgi:hypothetical protein
VRHDDRADEPGCRARDGERDALSQNHHHDIPVRRSEGEPNPDFVRALADRVRNHTVNAERREQQRRQREQDAGTQVFAVGHVDADKPAYGRLYANPVRSIGEVRSLGPKLLAVTLLGVFGFAVLVLSSFGIYAVVSQSLHERGQELRLRLTFGAAPGQLFVAELKRVGSVVIMSAAIGGAVAFGALRLLAATFPGFAGPVVIPLLVSTTTLIALALGTTTVPAYQACRRDVLNRV